MNATLVHVRDPFHPGMSREVHGVLAGSTLAELAPRTEAPFIILRNGEAVLRADWDQTVSAGDVVAVVHLPRGGGKSNPLRFVLMIAVAMVAPAVGQAVAWSAASGSAISVAGFNTIAAAVSAAVGIAGTALVNVLIPPPKPSTPALANALAAPSPTYTLTAQGNTARLDQAIPVQYGRMMAYPDFASLPYTEYAGQEQYLFQLLCLGAGYYDIEAVRIEDTAITSFDEIEYEVIEPGGTVTLFPTNVVTVLEVAGQELLSPDYIGPFTVNAAGTQVNALAFDAVAPRGLYFVDGSGNLSNQSVTLKFEAREIDDDGVAVGSWAVLGTETITAKTTTPQRYSYRYDVTLGRYEVRATRTDTKNTGASYGHEAVWAGARGYMPETRDFGNVTLLAMRLKASNNLSELASRRINVIATRKLPVWNGSSWSSPTSTASIAWAFADALRNTDYGAGLADSRIDLAALLTLDATWAARGDEFNGRFDSSMVLWEALTKIAAAGRAKPFLQGGIVRIVRDQAQTTPVALFSMRNIVRGSFSVEYLLPSENTSDAVEASYFDRSVWGPRRVLAALPDSSAATPAKIDLALGITDREHAYREAMYQSASNRYRRRLARFRTEMEGFIPSLGDLIAIQHDMPAWGQHAEVVDSAQANNLVPRSEQFDLWDLGSTTVAANTTDTLSPRGDYTADKITSVTDSRPRRQITPITPGSAYTVSVFAKAGTANWLRMRFDNIAAWFDLASGAVGTDFTGTADIEPVGDGWFRCYFTRTASFTSAQFEVYSVSANGSAAASGTVYLWGAQVEHGSALTPYFQTTTVRIEGVTVLTLSDRLSWDDTGTLTHYIGLRNKAGGLSGPYAVTPAMADSVVFAGVLPAPIYTGTDYERTHVVFGWSETWRQLAKVISVKPVSLYQVEIEAINEDDSVHTAETGQVAPPVQSSQLTLLRTAPVIANLVMRSSTSDTSKALLTWAPAPGATTYQIEMAAGTDAGAADLAWTRVGETTASSFAVTALYGAATLIRVRGVGLTAGPWVTALFGESADYMWGAASDLMWSATDTDLMWRY